MNVTNLTMSWFSYLDTTDFFSHTSIFVCWNVWYRNSNPTHRRYPACWGRQIDVGCHVKMLCSQDFAWKKMNGESSSYDKVESLLQGGSSEPHNVPLEYLRNITNNFSNELLLGEGGFGTVYKVRLNHIFQTCQTYVTRLCTNSGMY